MEIPSTHTDWNKVRKLYSVWADRTKYFVPTTAYKITALIGILLSILLIITGNIRYNGSPLGLLLVIITVFSGIQYIVRTNNELESYVEGFQQGIDFRDSNL